MEKVVEDTEFYHKCQKAWQLSKDWCHPRMNPESLLPVVLTLPQATAHTVEEMENHKIGHFGQVV